MIWNRLWSLALVFILASGSLTLDALAAPQATIQKACSHTLLTAEELARIAPRLQQFDNSLVFSPREYASRMNRLRRAMVRKNLDLMIVSFAEHIGYLTGYHTTGYDSATFLIIPRKGEVVTVSRLLEDTNFLARTWIKTENRWPYPDTVDPFDKLEEVLMRYGFDQYQNVGVDLGAGHLVSAATQEKIRAFFGNRKIIDTIDIFRQMRWKKSAEELAAMKKAAEFTVIGMRAAIDAIRPGATDNDVYAAAYSAMLRAGSEPPEIRPYITAGPWTLVGHASVNNRVIQEGDVVFLELTGQYKRYIAPMMRTVFVGNEAPQKLHEGAEMVIAKLEHLKRNMVPGTRLEDLFSPFDPESLQSIGATSMTRHGYSIGGNGLAPGWNETPAYSLKPGERKKLVAGATMHVIPWIQFIGSPELYSHLQADIQVPAMAPLRGVIGISDSLVATKEGARSLFAGLNPPPLELIVKGAEQE